VASQHDADRLGVACGHLGDVEAELETGPAPGCPDDSLTEASLGERFPVGSGSKSDPCVRVKVVDVFRLNEAVHGGVDRGRRTTLTVQAKVESGNHFVLTPLARVDRYQFAQTVQPKNGQPLFGQRGEVAPRALYPHELDLPARKWVGGVALGRGVPAGIIRISRVSAEPVGAVQKLSYGLGRG
jgi:hypothetical protein